MTRQKDTSITLGGIAINTLFQSAKKGDVTAAIYILEHPNIGHINVYNMLHGCQQGANMLKKKLIKSQINIKKGKAK